MVVSTDSYCDLWNDCFGCIKKYWEDCPYKIVLVNNSIDFNYPNIEIINCGTDAQWSERTRKALQKIDTKYVCFMLEDFFISASVNSNLISEAISFMDEHGINYYKLMSLTKFISDKYNSFDYLQKITQSYPYGISLMPAIWNRDFFLEKIGEGKYNPWKFEIDRLEEEKKSSNSSKIIGVFDNRNILNITHMVVQGKFLPSAIKKMGKLGFCQTPLRKSMSYPEYYFYRIKLFVTVQIRKYPVIRTLLSPLKKYSISEKYKS